MSLHACKAGGLLLAAGLTETGWICGVRHADSLLGWLATALAVGLSLALALRATGRWSATTVYILFTALGTLGVTLAAWLGSGETPGTAQLIGLAALIIGIAGLQHATTRP